MNTQVVTIGLGYIGLPTSALIAQNKIAVLVCKKSKISSFRV